MGRGDATSLATRHFSLIVSRVHISLDTCVHARLFLSHVVDYLLHGEPVRRRFQPASWISPLIPAPKRSVPGDILLHSTNTTARTALIQTLSLTLSQPLHRAHITQVRSGQVRSGQVRLHRTECGQGQSSVQILVLLASVNGFQHYRLLMSST